MDIQPDIFTYKFIACSELTKYKIRKKFDFQRDIF